MNRPSSKKSYEKGKNTYTGPSFKKHIRRVIRTDGTDAFGALTSKGMSILTYKYSMDLYFAKWDIYSLSDGTVYLMEENCD